MSRSPINVSLFCLCFILVGCATRQIPDSVIGEHELQAYITVIKHSDSSIGLVYGGRDPVIKKGKVLSDESITKLQPYMKLQENDMITYEIQSIGYGVKGVNWYNWGATLMVDQHTKIVESFNEWERYTGIIGCP